MSLLPRWQRLHARCSRRSLSMAGLREGMEGFYLTCKIRPYFPIQLAEAGATGKCEHRSRGREGNRASVVQVFEGFCEPRRLGHCKIENKAASSGSYIVSANRNTTDQQPVAFSPWKPTYTDHAAVGIQK
ncbi:uncharacterized protein LOC131048262 isoform X5 [Cryptomeria japonica]|uniref:uncharacterized protein LOC131048262 isoform X5 n=1 Tax=Cryptomeria japonica TaxID=3369 RepID=UPI0027DA247C|nr:uncharacterized protein LOC131048262 isoform X5 [Cryptomeria japonica]